MNAITKTGWTDLFPGKGEPVLHQAIQSSTMTAIQPHYKADIEELILRRKMHTGRQPSTPLLQKDKRTP